MKSPQNINESIKVQEGSVVSREIVNKPSGTVTLFALDKDQGLSEHAAPYDALVIATEGNAEITVSGQKHDVKAGEMLRMPAGAPHAIKAPKPFKMLLIMIRS